MVAVFLTIVTSATLYYTVDAFAVGVDNFISTIFPKAQELRLQEKVDKGYDLDLADFEGMYFVDWVPKGFEVAEVDSEFFPKSVCYINAENECIWYYIYDDVSSLLIDDENATQKKIYVHDTWGKLIIKGDDMRIVWEDGTYLYMIFGSQRMQDDLIEMVQKSTKLFLED